MNEKEMIDKIEDILMRWNTHRLEDRTALLQLLTIVQHTDSYNKKWMELNHLKPKKQKG